MSTLWLLQAIPTSQSEYMAGHTEEYIFLFIFLNKPRENTAQSQRVERVFWFGLFLSTLQGNRTPKEDSSTWNRFFSFSCGPGKFKDFRLPVLCLKTGGLSEIPAANTNSCYDEAQKHVQFCTYSSGLSSWTAVLQD